MITTKQELKEYIERDMDFFHHFSIKEQVILRLTQDPSWVIKRYLFFLRKEEYYFNTHKNLRYLYYFRKKNHLGNRLGFKIPHNCFGPGLTIYHHGEIIVNEKARIGANCKLHGGNCIGNKGRIDIAPRIGDNLDMGIGAKVLGDVKLEDNVTIGAGAVVIKTYCGSSIVLVGVPAKKISK